MANSKGVRGFLTFAPISSLRSKIFIEVLPGSADKDRQVGSFRKSRRPGPDALNQLSSRDLGPTSILARRLTNDD